MTPEQRISRFQSAFECITDWMMHNEAPLLAKNLAPGATAERLAAAERELGAPLTPDLHALWSVHDGQRQEQNGFVGSYDLLSADGALGEWETVLHFVGFLREDPAHWLEAQVTEAEAASDQWLPFAARDSDSLVVHNESGRVFRCGKDVPPLWLVADSLLEWIETYAAAVTAGNYRLDEGFGDYYLEERDREAERKQAERDRMADDAARLRASLPLGEQMHAALGRKDASRAAEVLADASLRGPEVMAECVALLFRLLADSDPRLVAEAVRPMMRKLSLTPDQWAVVARGGDLLGNAAIRDFAKTAAGGGRSNP